MIKNEAQLSIKELIDKFKPNELEVYRHNFLINDYKLDEIPLVLFIDFIENHKVLSVYLDSI